MKFPLDSIGNERSASTVRRYKFVFFECSLLNGSLDFFLILDFLCEAGIHADFVEPAIECTHCSSEWGFVVVFFENFLDDNWVFSV